MFLLALLPVIWKLVWSSQLVTLFPNLFWRNGRRGVGWGRGMREAPLTFLPQAMHRLSRWNDLWNGPPGRLHLDLLQSTELLSQWTPGMHFLTRLEEKQGLSGASPFLSSL